MTFLVDAQLPPLLATWLTEKGFDTIHTNDLPAGDETWDAGIRRVADRDGRVLTTKDSDFYDSYLLQKAARQTIFDHDRKSQESPVTGPVSQEFRYHRPLIW